MNKMLKNVDLATLVGSWPYVPDPSAVAQPSLLTGVVSPYATIISVKKSNDFDLNGKSFKLYVDSFVGSPFTISFTADGMTLDQVVARINALTAAYGTVAYNDNGFLKLKSIVPGNDGYLRLQSIATSESVFSILGLFSETEVYGGEIRQAPHADPSRGVALPGQMLMARGESFSSNVLNRIAFQAANQATRLSGFYEKKRIAITTEKEITYGGSGTWFQTSDVMYTGAVGTPTPAQLESVIGIVDLDGNEIVREYEDDVRNYTPGDVIVASVDPVTNDQYIQITSATCTFDADDAEHEAYVVLGGLPPPDNTLNGVPLKVLRIITWAPPVFKVAVLAVDPSGNAHHFTSTPTSMYRTLINRYKVQVSGFYKEPGLVNRVENLNDQLVPPLPTVNLPVTRIEKNNRIVVDTANFVTNGVSEGDVVTWTGFATSGMFSNNGVYRVGKVVDEVTIELLDENFGPVLLNPSYSGAGDVVVKTDGRFWNNPYIKFDPQGRASPPVPTGNFKVIYQVQSSLKTSLDANPAAFATNVKYQQEASAVVERALIGIVGPTANNLTDVLDYLYGDARHNLEDLYAQSMREHHDYSSVENGGRHSTIHPDKIDMYPSVAGETVIVRSTSGEDSSPAIKISHKTSSGVRNFHVDSKGRVAIGAAAGSIDTSILAMSDSVDDVSAYLLASGTNKSAGFYTRAVTGTAYYDAISSGIAVLGRSDYGAGRSQYEFISELGVHDAKANLNFVVEGAGAVLKLDMLSPFNPWSYLVNLMSWDLTGFVGIGTAAPDHNLTIKSRSTSTVNLLSLDGFSVSQNTVNQNFRPRGETGSIVGTVQGYDNGATKKFSLLSDYDIHVLPVGASYLGAGGTDCWFVDPATSALVPIGTNNFGSSSGYVGSIYSRKLYGDAGDSVQYNTTENAWKYYIGSVVKASIGIDPVGGADWGQFCLGGNLGDLTSRLLKFSHYWDGATSWVNEIRFNDGNVNPKMLLHWDSSNPDAIAVRGDFGSGLNDLMLFEGKTFIPGENASSGYSVGTHDARWYEAFALWGHFDSIARLPVSAERIIDRNAQNAAVARCHVTSAGALADSDTSHWNVASITKLGGSGAYRITFDYPVDVHSSFHLTVKASTPKHCAIDGVAADGTYVNVGIWDGAGSLEDNEFFFSAVGKYF